MQTVEAVEAVPDVKEVVQTVYVDTQFQKAQILRLDDQVPVSCPRGTRLVAIMHALVRLKPTLRVLCLFESRTLRLVLCLVKVGLGKSF